LRLQRLFFRRTIKLRGARESRMGKSSLMMSSQSTAPASAGGSIKGALWGRGGDTVAITADYRGIGNPGYNRDRGVDQRLCDPPARTVLSSGRPFLLWRRG
jgi:hypothetical protein